MLHDNASAKVSGEKYGRQRREKRWILWSTEEYSRISKHTEFLAHKLSIYFVLLVILLKPQSLHWNVQTHTLHGHMYWSGFYFPCLPLISLTAFGQMLKSSSVYSRWSTYLRGADLHSWLAFVISVIVFISQSQLASGKNRQKEEERGELREGGKGASGLSLSDHILEVLYFHFDELEKNAPNTFYLRSVCDEALMGFFVTATMCHCSSCHSDIWHLITVHLEYESSLRKIKRPHL